MAYRANVQNIDQQAIENQAHGNGGIPVFISANTTRVVKSESPKVVGSVTANAGVVMHHSDKPHVLWNDRIGR